MYNNNKVFYLLNLLVKIYVVLWIYYFNECFLNIYLYIKFILKLNDKNILF